VTQSNAILRYIARKNDLLGKNEKECVRVDILAEQAMDFRNGFVRLSYNQNFVSVCAFPSQTDSQARDIVANYSLCLHVRA